MFVSRWKNKGQRWEATRTVPAARQWMVQRTQVFWGMLCAVFLRFFCLQSGGLLEGAQPGAGREIGPLFLCYAYPPGAGQPHKAHTPPGRQIIPIKLGNGAPGLRPIVTSCHHSSQLPVITTRTLLPSFTLKSIIMRKITETDIDRLRAVAYRVENQESLIPQLFGYFKTNLKSEGNSHHARMRRSAALHFFAAVECCLEDVTPPAKS